jgi:hypothetical protein
LAFLALRKDWVVGHSVRDLKRDERTEALNRRRTEGRSMPPTQTNLTISQVGPRPGCDPCCHIQML